MCGCHGARSTQHTGGGCTPAKLPLPTGCRRKQTHHQSLGNGHDHRAAVHKAALQSLTLAQKSKLDLSKLL